MTFAMGNHKLVNMKTDGCNITGMLHFFFKTEDTMRCIIVSCCIFQVHVFIYTRVKYTQHKKEILLT